VVNVKDFVPWEGKVCGTWMALTESSIEALSGCEHPEW
jgi:hypothetical protein